MIIGIGIDLVELERVRKLLDTFGERFINRVLNEQERTDYQQSSRKAWFVANRFAAKEAISKALGTGLRYPVTLLSMGVISAANGRPEFHFSESLQIYLDSREVSGAHLSITNEKGLACAVVVLEKNN